MKNYEKIKSIHYNKLSKILIISLSIIILCGCAINNNIEQENSTAVLSERQKIILLEQGLSENYEELTI